MAGLVFWAVVGAGSILAVIAVVLFAVVLRRVRRFGTRGWAERSHLHCPKCRTEFDYDWVPGVSFSAVRLGTGRYMACPSCGGWSYFDLYGTIVRRPAPEAPPPAPPP